MVTLNAEKQEACIYEIKYSNTINEKQYHYLKIQEYIDTISLAYYPVKHKIVLYRGEAKQIEDIEYQNIESYLKTI